MSSASEIIIQSDASKKGWEVLSESAKRRSVDSPEFKPPYHCSRIVSHQISPINDYKNCQSQISSFPSQRYQCIPDENGGGTQNKEIIVISKEIWDLQYSKRSCLLQNTCRGDWTSDRWGFQKFPRLIRMGTIFKSIPIPRNLCNLGISRVGTFCIKTMPSDTIPSYLLWEADPHILVTDTFQQSWNMLFTFFQ